MKLRTKAEQREHIGRFNHLVTYTETQDMLADIDTLLEARAAAQRLVTDFDEVTERIRHYARFHGAPDHFTEWLNEKLQRHRNWLARYGEEEDE